MFGVHAVFPYSSSNVLQNPTILVSANETSSGDSDDWDKMIDASTNIVQHA